MFLVISEASAYAADRPNILLILADDLADWMLGCYGNKEIKTPHIDELAKQGTRFARSFVCTPICSPSRATLFTGRVPRQHGIHDFLGPPIKEPPQAQQSPPASFMQEVMISDLLAAAGYHCGYIGKWHMGGDEKPLGHGYRFSYVPYRSAYQNPTFSRNGVLVKKTGYTTELCTEEARTFIKEQAGTQPWFLVVSYFNPHLPYTGHPQKYYDLYKDCRFETFGVEPRAPNALREAAIMNNPLPNLRGCAAATTALDDQIPPLLEAVEKSGQRDKTLIVFTADNGFLLGRHGLWSKGAASFPINMYEEVIRVPMIYVWPGKVPAGRVAEQMVSFYDVLPTLAEAAGANVPKDRHLTGHSYWPTVLGKDQPWENIVFSHFRYTDMVRDERYKLVRRFDGNGPNELWDLQADPRERHNRFDDPVLRPQRQQLEQRLNEWIKRTEEKR